MTKLLLSGIVLFAMTACDERVGRGIKAPTPIPLSMQGINDMTEEEMPTLVESEEVVVMDDVPILEDDLPTLTTPTNIEEPMAVEKGIKTSKKVPTVRHTLNGLDIGTIRISNSPERTRVVLDSYDSGAKASVAGGYAYAYDASKKRITLTLKNYANISALGSSKTRTYPQSSLVKKIYLSNSADTSIITCVIALRNAASVNVFDIKEPGRIVIDISPR